MTSRNSSAPFDFSRREDAPTPQLEAHVADGAPEAPPEAELDIVQAPAVEMAAPESVSPPPARAKAPNAEPPLTPAVIASTPRAVKEPSGWPVWVVALFVCALWAAAPVAFALGWRVRVVPLDNDPLAIALFGILAVGPAALVLVAAYFVRQGQKLAAEVRRMQDLSQRMFAPAALAAVETGSAVESVRLQIDSATGAAHEARETMLALRQALAEETERLTEAAAVSARTAADLSLTLGSEREQLGALSSQLDARSTAVADSITQQARMVAEASDLAETQLREAEAALAARAADLAAAAGEASDAARVAGEDLARQVARLETAGLGVGDQMRAVEQGLTQQRAALVTVAHAMRADQEDFAAMAESRSAQLAEFMVQSTESAASVGEHAAKGAEALRSLIGEAAERFTELTERAKAEREALGAESAEVIGQVGEAAARERALLASDLQVSIDRLAQAAHEARHAAEAHAEAAQSRVDQLSEAAFNAHQKADAIFEARLKEARDLIEQSAQMVEQAGATTAQRLEQGAQVARGALSDLERMLDEVDRRAAELPEAAKDRVEAVRASVEQSMDDLLSAARRAAEETQTIDAAFQERVRRNYDMLSEAVKVMGVAAGSAGNAAGFVNRFSGAGVRPGRCLARRPRPGAARPADAVGRGRRLANAPEAHPDRHGRGVPQRVRDRRRPLARRHAADRRGRRGGLELARAADLHRWRRERLRVPGRPHGRRDRRHGHRSGRPAAARPHRRDRRRHPDSRRGRRPRDRPSPGPGRDPTPGAPPVLRRRHAWPDRPLPQPFRRHARRGGRARSRRLAGGDAAGQRRRAGLVAARRRRG